MMTCTVLLGLSLTACEGAHRALTYTSSEAPSIPLNETTYPSDDWGSTVGKTLPNFTLTGVLSGSSPDVTGPVSMADYFDPDGEQIDLLHITLVTLWCPHCTNQSVKIGANSEWLRKNRVANVEIVIDGPQAGTAPTLKDASAWAVRHGLFFPILVDVKAAITGKIWDIQSIPMHIVVNPRDMRILDIRTGEIPNLIAYEQGFLDKVRPLD
jgi:hypothetical protein